MRGKIKKLTQITAFVLAFLSSMVLGLVFAVGNDLPNYFQVVKGGALSIDRPYTVTVAYAKDNVVAADRTNQNKYNVDLKLFGVIPIKQVQVQSVESAYVIPCGTPFGIKIFTQGVLIVGMTDVDSDLGLINPAENAGLKEGDIINAIDGKQVNSNEDVANMIEKSDGNAVEMAVTRKNMSFSISFTPVKSKIENKYKAGMWVRDSSAGIGTMTFYMPDRGISAGLGHGICDVDTGELLPLMSGEIVGAKITSVIKGQKGTPGELRGQFIEGEQMGKILTNSETGVFSRIFGSEITGNKIRIAMRQEVKQGAAKILTTINGCEPKYYDCQIEKVHFNDDSPTKNMVIRVTDKSLLEKTGGIVQGMSGSPIIQNGMLVGAVTHVFVSDSTRGYAIFAENMYIAAEKAQKLEIGKAS